MKNLIQKITLPLILSGSLALGGCQNKDNRNINCPNEYCQNKDNPNKYEKVCELIGQEGCPPVLCSDGLTTMQRLNFETENALGTEGFFLVKYSFENKTALNIIKFKIGKGVSKGFYDYGTNGMGDSLDVYTVWKSLRNSKDFDSKIEGEGTKTIAKEYDSHITSILDQHKYWEKF